MKEFCRTLSWFVLILGLIGAFLIANTYGVTSKVSTSRWGDISTTTERNWPLTIGIFIGIVVSVLVIFAILGALAEILERLKPKKDETDEIKKNVEVIKEEAIETQVEENVVEEKISEEPENDEKDKTDTNLVWMIFIIFVALLGVIIILKSTL